MTSTYQRCRFGATPPSLGCAPAQSSPQPAAGPQVGLQHGTRLSHHRPAPPRLTWSPAGGSHHSLRAASRPPVGPAGKRAEPRCTLPQPASGVKINQQPFNQAGGWPIAVSLVVGPVAVSLLQSAYCSQPIAVSLLQSAWWLGLGRGRGADHMPRHIMSHHVTSRHIMSHHVTCPGTSSHVVHTCSRASKGCAL